MHRVRWTRRALSHLDSIAAYIKERNPQAAERVTKRIRDRVHQLEAQPFLAREGGQPGTRDLFVGRYQYKVVYRVREDVEILAVFHTPRNATTQTVDRRTLRVLRRRRRDQDLQNSV